MVKVTPLHTPPPLARTLTRDCLGLLWGQVRHFFLKHFDTCWETSGPGCLGSKSSSSSCHAGAWALQRPGLRKVALLSSSPGGIYSRPWLGSHCVAACFTVFVRFCFEGRLAPRVRFLVSDAQLPGLLVASKNTPGHSEQVTLCDLTRRRGRSGLICSLVSQSRPAPGAGFLRLTVRLVFVLWTIQGACGHWCHFPSPWPRRRWEQGPGLSELGCRLSGWLPTARDVVVGLSLSLCHPQLGSLDRLLCRCRQTHQAR